MKKTLLFFTGLLFTSNLLSQPYIEYGIASYYHDTFAGRPTSNGEIFRQDLLTAAHKTLPFNTVVRVTNLSNNRTVDVKINDRGPFITGRIIDLSRAAARVIDMEYVGITEVKVEIIKQGDAPAVALNTTPPAQPRVRVVRVSPEEVAAATASNSGYDMATLKQQVYRKRGKLFNSSYTVLPHSGAGFQVGAYAGFENLKQHLQRLSPIHGKILIYTDDSATPLHKLIIGPFENREAAEDYMQQLPYQFASEKNDSFFVDLSSLK